jgi:hypothetical protein
MPTAAILPISPNPLTVVDFDEMGISPFGVVVLDTELT